MEDFLATLSDLRRVVYLGEGTPLLAGESVR